MTEPESRYVTVRELYDKLDNDIQPRLRRVEVGIAVLIVMAGSQFASVFSSPSVPQVAYEAAKRLLT